MEGTEEGENASYEYTGQEYEDLSCEMTCLSQRDELDLHNFRARFYDSDLMRFYAVDPAMQTASPYLYCGNSPLMYVDEDGEWFLTALYYGYQIYKYYNIAKTAYGVYKAIDTGNYGAAVGIAMNFAGSQLTGVVSSNLFNIGLDHNPLLSTLSGAISGAGGGALSAAMTGQNILDGAKSGAITGGVMGFATSQHVVNYMEGPRKYGFNNDETVYSNLYKQKNGFEEIIKWTRNKYNLDNLKSGYENHFNRDTGEIMLNKESCYDYSSFIGALDHEIAHSFQESKSSHIRGRSGCTNCETGATNNVMKHQGRYYGIDRKKIVKQQANYQQYSFNPKMFDSTRHLAYKSHITDLIPWRSSVVRYLRWGYNNVTE